MSRAVRGARPSPNIWDHPGTYEIENRAFDPDRLVESAMRNIADWRGRQLLDIGCGTGFHLPRWAETAAHVIGVEPHHQLRALAVRRTRRHPHVEVRPGLAQSLPVPDASIDIAHARWAYFLGPGAEAGLTELQRVMRRGATAYVIDNDSTRSTFGRWFTQGFRDVDPVATQRFWSTNGWERTRVLTRWEFASRGDLEAVVRIELPPGTAEAALAEHPPDLLSVDYAVNLWWRHF